MDHAYACAEGCFDEIYCSGEAFRGVNIGEACAVFDMRFLNYTARYLNSDGSLKKNAPQNARYNSDHIDAVKLFLSGEPLSPEQLHTLYEVIAVSVYDSF